jgi:hypothetical protein
MDTQLTFTAASRIYVKLSWNSFMAAKQNITVAIEPTLLKQARAIAARRGLSVSA